MIPLRDDIPTRVAPVVTMGLIATCVVIFLWQSSHSMEGQEAIAYGLGAVPAVVVGATPPSHQVAWVPPAATLITSMFLHGGWLHLAGNMLYLWIFGNNVEDSMGRFRFILFYLLCGLAAALAQTFAYPSSELPMIGASGAISGVLGAYLLLYPRARVLVLIPLGFLLQAVALPAILVLGLWFLLQVISTVLANPDEGGVAFLAHIGGFLAGMILIHLFRRRDLPLQRSPFE